MGLAMRSDGDWDISRSGRWKVVSSTPYCKGDAMVCFHVHYNSSEEASRRYKGVIQIHCSLLYIGMAAHLITSRYMYYLTACYNIIYPQISSIYSSTYFLIRIGVFSRLPV